MGGAFYPSRKKLRKFIVQCDQGVPKMAHARNNHFLATLGPVTPNYSVFALQIYSIVALFLPRLCRVISSHQLGPVRRETEHPVENFFSIFMCMNQNPKMRNEFLVAIIPKISKMTLFGALTKTRPYACACAGKH